MILYLLTSLGVEYDSVAIEFTAWHDVPSFEEIQFLLLNQEMRIEKQHNGLVNEVSYNQLKPGRY